MLHSVARRGDSILRYARRAVAPPGLSSVLSSFPGANAPGFMLSSLRDYQTAQLQNLRFAFTMRIQSGASKLFTGQLLECLAGIAIDLEPTCEHGFAILGQGYLLLVVITCPLRHRAAYLCGQSFVGSFAVEHLDHELSQVFLRSQLEHGHLSRPLFTSCRPRGAQLLLDLVNRRTRFLLGLCQCLENLGSIRIVRSPQRKVADNLVVIGNQYSIESSPINW